MKKKTIVFIATLAILVALVFVFSNCSKSDDLKKELSKSEEYNDYFLKKAEYHNDCLEYVATHGDITTMSQKERFELANEFLGTTTAWEDAEKMIREILPIAHGETPARMLLTKSKDWNPSEEYLMLVEQLEVLFNNALAIAKQGQHTTPDQFDSNVESLIKLTYDQYPVKLDEEMGLANEFGFFVAQCYLAKETYRYWHEAFSNPAHLWHNFIRNAEDYPERGFWNWIVRAASDVWGFVSSASITISTDGWSLTWDIDDAIDNASHASASV
ncbi:MAG: hypothetical protein PHE03_00460 [Bacteroidales bacterium]|nr:hypothetical protein [Bacteroidales bacterium]MDD3890760.1 hypothetical protein [Bacteroidales bacterium]